MKLFLIGLICLSNILKCENMFTNLHRENHENEGTGGGPRGPNTAFGEINEKKRLKFLNTNNEGESGGGPISYSSIGGEGCHGGGPRQTPDGAERGKRPTLYIVSGMVEAEGLKKS